MASEILKYDQNSVRVLAGVTNDSNQEIRMLRVDPTTKKLLVVATGSGGTGTVTSVSVVSANGFAGTVATATTTPAITLTTTITGILKGNGTAISAATAGTDYVTASSTNTFTNKTFDADGTGNSITNIENADIKAAAAIAVNKLAALTASRAVVTDASGFISAATTTSVEIGYVNGVTSAIQTQLNAKVTSVSGTTNRITSTGGTTPVIDISATFEALLGKVANRIDQNNAATTSAQLASVISDETGTGALVFATSPSFTTPTIGGVAIPSISSTNTLTNKRVTKRLVSVSGPGATPTTNTDNCDIAEFTALATAITSMTTNLSGTPVNGDMLEFVFVDNGTARAITWGASFANGPLLNLPTTTVISTVLRVLVQYQTTASLNKWVCVGLA